MNKMNPYKKQPFTLYPSGSRIIRPKQKLSSHFEQSPTSLSPSSLSGESPRSWDELETSILKTISKHVDSLFSAPTKPNIISISFNNPSLNEFIQSLIFNLESNKVCIVNIKNCHPELFCLIPMQIVKYLPKTIFYNPLRVQNGTNDDDIYDDFKIFNNILVFIKDGSDFKKLNLPGNILITEVEPPKEEIQSYLDQLESKIMASSKT